jgi:hypothetical protein
MIHYVRAAAGGSATVSARSDIQVGVATSTFTVPLGEWPLDAPDPGGPLGLGAAPVIIVAHPALVTIADAGARRAGRDATIARIAAGARLGLDLLAARSTGADLMIVAGAGEELRVARVIGGRPLAALPLPSPAEIAAFLDGIQIDVTVAVPSGEDELRRRIRAIVAPLELESLHHFVEVDPRPAFDELGLDVHDARLDQLAAAAAGILAGRLAAANARWRRDTGA